MIPPVFRGISQLMVCLATNKIHVPPDKNQIFLIRVCSVHIAFRPSLCWRLVLEEKVTVLIYLILDARNPHSKDLHFPLKIKSASTRQTSEGNEASSNTDLVGF